MSIVLLGSTSGSCTLQEQAVAGTSVLTLPVGTGTVVANNVNSAIVSGTSVASTSGTSIDFTSIPSWVKRITVMFSGVSTNGTSNFLIQLGDAGGIETTNYLGTVVTTGNSVAGAAVNFSSGFLLNYSSASVVTHGICTFTTLGSNIWAGYGLLGRSDTTNLVQLAGSKTLSETLDRIRITTVNGTDTFDAGTINILYE